VQYCRGELTDPSVKSEFTGYTNQLRGATSLNCNILITTLSNAEAPDVYTNFQPHVIVVDEAARATETETLPI